MKKPITIATIAIVAVIVIGILSTTLYYINMMNPVRSESEEVIADIEEGKSASDIGSILKEKGLIKSELVFKIYVKLNNINDMQAGEYVLDKNMSVSEIVQVLEEGPDKNQRTVNITFLEGKNFRWIAKEIADKTNNSEDDVYNTLNNEEYINSLIEKYWFITNDIKDSNIYYSLEGYLFPDTYNFKNKDVTVEEIFNTLLDQMENKLEDYKTEIKNSGISVHKLLTLASIVELEASNPGDRASVASVIYNRLKSNMAIGSDVTTYYAIKVDMSERDLRQSELNTYNPYNTRGSNMQGKLPVGPICMVGIESIKAALHPDETNYLFFVADKNGKIYFAKTNKEQEENIKYLKEHDLWFSYE